MAYNPISGQPVKPIPKQKLKTFSLYKVDTDSMHKKASNDRDFGRRTAENKKVRHGIL